MLQEAAVKTWDYLLEADPLTMDRSDRLVGAISHPIAATLGALTGGGATGAIIGMTAGPLGIAVGAVLGAFAGGLGTDAVASSVAQVSSSTHSRTSRAARTDLTLRATFQDYAGAHGDSRLSWAQARSVAYVAWERR